MAQERTAELSHQLPSGEWVNPNSMVGNYDIHHPYVEPDKWPATLNREQFLNALDQFMIWLDDGADSGETDDMDNDAKVRAWMDHMDAIQPCWPNEDD